MIFISVLLMEKIVTTVMLRIMYLLSQMLGAFVRS